MAPAEPGRVVGEPARGVAVRGCFVAGPVRVRNRREAGTMQLRRRLLLSSSVGGRWSPERNGDNPMVRSRSCGAVARAVHYGPASAERSTETFLTQPSWSVASHVPDSSIRSRSQGN
jgi:hypothetical protein